MACSSPACAAAPGVGALEPEAEVVVHGHLERRGQVQQLLQPRPGRAGGADRARVDRRTGGRLERGGQRRADVAADVVGGGLHLDAEQDLAVRADQGRGAAGQHAGQRHVAAVRRPQRRRRRRHQLAQRHPVGLARQALERPGHRRGVAGAVAVLVAAAGAAGARGLRVDALRRVGGRGGGALAGSHAVQRRWAVGDAPGRCPTRRSVRRVAASLPAPRLARVTCRLRSTSPIPPSSPTPTRRSRGPARSRRCSGTRGCGLWLAFTHAEANAVLRDRRLGRIWRDKEPAERFESFNLIHRNAILEMEPPHHTRLRRLISTAFARGHVERLRPWVEELAGRLVDELVERVGGLASRSTCCTGMAEQLPVAVIAELLGVPEADRPLLRPWSNAIVKMYEYGRTPAARGRRRARGRRVRHLPARAGRRAPPAPRRRPGQPPGRASATPRATG